MLDGGGGAVRAVGAAGARPRRPRRSRARRARRCASRDALGAARRGALCDPQTHVYHSTARL